MAHLLSIVFSLFTLKTTLHVKTMLSELDFYFATAKTNPLKIYLIISLFTIKTININNKNILVLYTLECIKVEQ